MEHNVTVNLKKCQFFKSEATFLDHIISNQGIKMDNKKIKTIQDFKAPSNKKELQSFLGFLNFYRRFIDKFAHRTTDRAGKKGQKMVLGRTSSESVRGSKIGLLTRSSNRIP